MQDYPVVRIARQERVYEAKVREGPIIPRKPTAAARAIRGVRHLVHEVSFSAIVLFCGTCGAVVGLVFAIVSFTSGLDERDAVAFRSWAYWALACSIVLLMHGWLVRMGKSILRRRH